MSLSDPFPLSSQPPPFPPGVRGSSCRNCPPGKGRWPARKITGFKIPHTRVSGQHFKRIPRARPARLTRPPRLPRPPEPDASASLTGPGSLCPLPRIPPSLKMSPAIPGFDHNPAPLVKFYLSKTATNLQLPTPHKTYEGAESEAEIAEAGRGGGNPSLHERMLFLPRSFLHQHVTARTAAGRARRDSGSITCFLFIAESCKHVPPGIEIRM